MGKKERNVLARIERQSTVLPPAKSLASRSAFKELSKLAMEWNSVPGEWRTEIIEHDSPPLSEEEQNALDDILSSCDDVYFNPRKRKQYIMDSSALRKYQILGFEDYVSYCGYLSVNGLNNLVKDFDAVYGDKESE
ncbi:TPA: hypothetical protein ACHSNO_004639 [Klebsiella pneumoniae]|uniref:hypothetical protein n=1 Tax=Klebsiella pneumoniae complex TaxID=3390273 RepID=UPI000A26C104|nr:MULTISPECIES: hypothetical protein [Klebsiella]UYM67417.1 hypothetical protein OGZ26_02975 [Escherichia coli]HBR1711122.1 hypothetical protein [Klebsiella quasipneumoniae subsp. similipneumoniae]AVJ58376.1 hypothetical protein CLQ71_05330 [Klebsiella variicola]EIX9417520.1 hypothetical protein [Klebsiella pneumoniae]EIY5235198.1 hypothetical protein [Klebsiella quasipneumoniae]